MTLSGDEPYVVGWTRLAWLITLLLMVIHVYRRLPVRLNRLADTLEETHAELATVRDTLTAYSSELQTISEHALRQTQELLFLLEASKAIGASLDLSEVLQKIIESTALAVSADHAVIALTDGPDGERMSIIAGYDPLHRRVWQSSDVHLTVSNYPAIQNAVQRRQQIVIQDVEYSGDMLALHALLGTPKVGPVVIQPLVLQDRVLGMVLLGNSSSKCPITDGELSMTNALATQAVTAVENARLYKELDEHSQELACLLRAREEEAAERRAILESIADGVVVSDARGRVTMVNAAAEWILGLTQKQLQRRFIGQVFGGSLKNARVTVKRDGATGQASAVQSTQEWAGRTVQTNLSPVKHRDGGLLGYVGVLRDVTREMSAERAKSEFISNISHELRTPMTSIKGYLELIIEGAAGELSEMQQNFLGTIKSNADRMVKLLNNLIAVAEMGTDDKLNVQQVNLSALLEDAVARVRPEATEQRLTMDVKIANGGLPVVEVDPVRVIQVLAKLLENACHFTKEGGHIEVRARERIYDGRREVMMAVADTGIGISPEDQERIFDPFYQVGGDSAETDGAGVGLAIAQAQVQAHGGRLWVESQPGEGSTFYFTLPVVSQG